MAGPADAVDEPSFAWRLPGLQNQVYQGASDMIRSCKSFCLFLPLFLAVSPAFAAECESWASRHPEWIFCDDFESSAALVGPNRYFEHDNNKGDFQPMAAAGWKGSRGMRTLWQTGEVDAGNLKLGFGRLPGTYMSKGIRANQDFREVYYRMYIRTQEGWQGDPFKLSRATVVAKADWSQAMIAHLWGDRAEHLQLDPASCTDAAGNVVCSGYNDFNNIKWIGAKAGLTKPYSGENAGKWVCVEAHVRLNDPGQTNGVHEFWIEDKLEARRDNLNFLGSYKEYGINGIYFENHWNSGSPKVQERFFDNIVVSTQRVTCADGGMAPTDVTPPVPQHLKTLPPAGSLLRGPGVIPWVKALDGRRSVIGRMIDPLIREEAAAGPPPDGTPIPAP